MPTVDIPIYSTIDVKTELIAPCNTDQSGGAPVLYVDKLQDGCSLSVYSLNQASGDWEFCKFKDGSNMVITNSTSRQIMMEKGNYQIKCELEITDASGLPKLSEVNVGDDLAGKVLIFPTDKNYDVDMGTTFNVINFGSNDNKDNIAIRGLGSDNNRPRMRIFNEYVYSYPNWLKSFYIFNDNRSYIVSGINFADQTIILSDTLIIDLPKARF